MNKELIFTVEIKELIVVYIADFKLDDPTLIIIPNDHLVVHNVIK
jgi:hypothetical protein